MSGFVSRIKKNSGGVISNRLEGLATKRFPTRGASARPLGVLLPVGSAQLGVANGGQVVRGVNFENASSAESSGGDEDGNTAAAQ